MLKDAFDSTHCYKTFKESREYVLKRHTVCYHFNINNLNDKEREQFLIDNQRLVGKKGTEPKVVPELKMEISSLISLEIIRKGRPFSDDDFIKQLLKKSEGFITFQNL